MDEKELQEFKVNYFMKSSVETTVEEAVEVPTKPAIKPPVMKAPPTPEVEEVYDIEEEAPKKPAKASVKAAPKDEVDELPMTASGDLDIDALLGDLQ